MASNYQSPPAPVRSSRSQTVTYADLMKPDEDWRTLANASERRKIQNRLAQRAYRRNMRDRTKEVEKLKKQLQQLQHDKERQGSRDVTPSSDLDAGAHSPSPRPEPTAMVGSTTPMITTSDWTGGVYVPAWSGPTPEPEQQQQQQQQLHSLALQDAEHPLNYDAPSFFPALPGTHEFPAMASPPPMTGAPAGGRSRAVSACSLSSPRVPPQHLRSSSHPPPPCFAPRGVSPAPGAWGPPPPAEGGGEAYDSLQVPLAAPPPPGAAYDLYRDDAVLGLPQPDAFSLDDGGPHAALPLAAYPSPPDTSDPQHGWTGYESREAGRARSPSTASAALLFEQQQQQAHGEAAPARVLPDTNAPLLHLAVLGGHLDTLRFLLQRYDININGRNNQGYTAIQLAVMGGRTNMVALLLEHGADVNTEDLGEGESRLG